MSKAKHQKILKITEVLHKIPTRSIKQSLNNLQST